MPRKKKKTSLVEKRIRARLVVGALFFLFIVVILVGLAYGARRPEVTISDVVVSGTNFVESNDAKKIAQESLEGSYLLLIPHKNSFVYPNRAIEDSLVEAFLPIKSVSIDRDGLTKLEVSVEERNPIALWCDNTASTSPCYYIDEEGLLFVSADGDSQQNIMMYHGTSLGLGEVFLGGAFPKLNELIGKLNTATGKTVREVTVDESNDVFVSLNEGGELRFVLDFDLPSLLDNVASVFSSKRFTTDEALEYADFRFGNKVYVKFSGE